MKSTFLVKTMVLVAVVLLQFASIVSAQSFHLKNNSNSPYRMRVMNNGHWGEYVQALPGSTVTAASGVTRSDHNVELEVYENGQWKTVVTERRGSRAFSRVAVITEDTRGDQYLQWKDQMPVTHNLVPSGSTGVIGEVGGRLYDVGKSTYKIGKKVLKKLW